MLVCHCRIITDRHIREAVQEGARTLEGVSKLCGAGTGCGGCKELVECILADELGAESRTVVQLRRESHSAGSTAQGSAAPLAGMTTSAAPG